MKRLPFPTAKVLLASAATLSLGWLSTPQASATSYTFTGTGDWYTAGTSPNWSPTVTNGLTSGFLNTAGNSVTINGVVNYNAGPAGGDFQVGQGNTMYVDGSNGTASWTQALGTNNWVKVGASGTAVSTVDVSNGGTFNVFSANQRLRVGVDGGVGNFVVERTGGGLNLTNGSASTLGGTVSNLLEIGSTSTVSLLGGTNYLAEISNGGTMTYSGGTTTTGQWDNTAGTFIVTGGTITATNYDMNTAGAKFNVSGGSVAFTGVFTNWRNVTITGGSVSVAGTVTTNASTVFSMNAGTFTKSGGGNLNLDSAATFTLAGSASFNMTGTGEFQPGYASGGTAVQSISDRATLTIAGLVAFQGGNTQKFDINGGTINIGSSGNNGIYSAGGYFNFTSGSTGKIDLQNVSVANAIADINAGKIKASDMSYTTANYSSMFTVESDGGNGSFIYLIGSGTAVPEPATWATGVLLVGTAGWVRRRTLRGMLRVRA